MSKAYKRPAYMYMSTRDQLESVVAHTRCRTGLSALEEPDTWSEYRLRPDKVRAASNDLLK